MIEGVASVDESAITGESAPVIREAGGDRSAVTGGLRVLSDWIKVRITSNPGETFIDRMIALVEGISPENAERDRSAHIARRLDHHIFTCGCHIAAIRDLFRCGADDLCFDLIASVLDTDHDRRPAVRYRYCGNGQACAA